MSNSRRERGGQSRLDADVIIVGAGVVGAAAALGLAERDQHIALIEAHQPARWQTDTPDLRVYAIAPDSVDLFQQLKIWPQIVSCRAQPYQTMRVWDAASDGELTFSADQLGVNQLGFIVEHALLVDQLWQACQRHPNITCHVPQRAAALIQNNDYVELTLADERTLRATLLLGADGAASKVRQLAGISIDEHDYQQTAIVAYVITEAPHQNTAWQRFTSQGPLAFLPVQATPSLQIDRQVDHGSACTSSIVWSQPSDEAQRRLALSDDLFCNELSRAFDARLGRVLAISQRHGLPLRRRLASQMLHDRIALIGDAAHAVHPLAGQGMNLGLRDVTHLLDIFDNAQSRGRAQPTPTQLQRWARSRHSDNTLSAKSFEWINRIYSNDSPALTLLRGPVLSLANRLNPINRALWQHAAGRY